MSEGKCPYCGGPNHKKCPGPGKVLSFKEVDEKMKKQSEEWEQKLKDYAEQEAKAQEDHVAHEKDYRKEVELSYDMSGNYTDIHTKMLEILLDEIDRLKNELLDAIDCKNGKGPTALSMVIQERDALRARVKELEKREKDLLCEIGELEVEKDSMDRQNLVIKARVKELETTYGLKCDNCGGELKLVHNPSLYHPAYYRCKRCMGVGYITKPSISIGMIPVKKEGE